MEKDILLELENVHVQYGGVHALDGASVSIDEGEVVALVGPNGAGKSTILKAIFGLAPIKSGKVKWHGAAFAPVPHEVVGKGIAFVPQGRRVFTDLTVRENLEVGGYVVKDKKELARRIDEVMEFFPVLKSRQHAKSREFSGGQQQMLAIARGLITDPKVLLLDEPSLGLAPKIVKEVFTKIGEINEHHKTAIIIVEHNIKSLMEIAHRAYILDKGQVVMTGDAKGVADSTILEDVFMGRYKGGEN